MHRSVVPRLALRDVGLRVIVQRVPCLGRIGLRLVALGDARLRRVGLRVIALLSVVLRLVVLRVLRLVVLRLVVLRLVVLRLVVLRLVGHVERVGGLDVVLAATGVVAAASVRALAGIWSAGDGRAIAVEVRHVRDLSFERTCRFRSCFDMYVVPLRAAKKAHTAPLTQCWHTHFGFLKLRDYSLKDSRKTQVTPKLIKKPRIQATRRTAQRHPGGRSLLAYTAFPR